MSAVKIRNLPELHFGKRLSNQTLGPSVSGGTFLSQKPNPQSQAPQPTSQLAIPSSKKQKAFSDDSYDSSTSLDEKIAAPKWTKLPFQVFQRKKVIIETAASASVGNLFQDSIWETTRKVNQKSDSVISEETKIKQGKRKSKRHCSLDAKTARYYAKRQQPDGNKGKPSGSTSSSDEESGFKLRRERSPRRKKGSNNSKPSSRDPSVASNQSPQQQKNPSLRPDLPPSTNGVLRRSPPSTTAPLCQPNKPIPAIQVTPVNVVPEVLKVRTTKQLYPSYDDQSFTQITAEAQQGLDEWLSSRSEMKRNVQNGSTQSLVFQPQPKAAFPPQNPPTLLAPNLLWNHAMSRHSLPAGIDESVLNQPANTESTILVESVKSKRQFFEQLKNIEINASNVSLNQPRLDKPFFTSVVKPTDQQKWEPITGKKEALRNPYPQNRLLVVPEHGKLALALNSAKSSELLELGSGVTADSRFLHHAIQTSANAAKILDQVRPKIPSRPGKPLDTYAQIKNNNLSVRNVEDDALHTNKGTVRWSSDWQLHQSSSGTNKPAPPYRPSSVSAFDPYRLGVPSRLAPLKEANHVELQRALEELDEFYESLSTKSEDVTMKSSTGALSGMRSDSGLSSLRHVPTGGESPLEQKPYLDGPDRTEYTKQWVHDDHSNESRAIPSPGSSLHQHIGADNPSQHGPSGIPNNPDRRARRSARGPNIQKDDYAHRKARNKQPKKPTVLPNPSYLLMSVVFTPTVFTGSQLEFQNYPGTNRPQPHIEMDDLSLRKTIHSQNTPLYKVTADLSKQLPSSRNDYAVPNVTGFKRENQTGRFREPDLVRDDAAFRQLRSDQKMQPERPQTLAVNVTIEQPPSDFHSRTDSGNGVRSRSISSSIKQLARHFEVPKTSTKSERKPFFSKLREKSKSSPMPETIQAAMQIDGRKVKLRSSSSQQTSPKSPTTKDDQSRQFFADEVSPKISPMNDQQLDDLLFSLHSLSPPRTTVAEKLQRGSSFVPKSTCLTLVSKAAVSV